MAEEFASKALELKPKSYEALCQGQEPREVAGTALGLDGRLVEALLILLWPQSFGA